MNEEKSESGQSQLARLWPVLLAVGVTAYVCLVAYGAGKGVRGDDQYWYLADITTLVNGGDAVSNFVFPYTIATEGYTGPGEFVHNILYPYLAAVPGAFFGAYTGAIVTNLIGQLAAVLIIFLIALRLRSDPGLATGIALLYLFFPLNYWYSVNVYAEASMTALVALLALIATWQSPGTLRWMLAAVVIGVLMFARGSFLLLGILLPVAYLIDERSKEHWRWLGAAALFVIIASFNYFWEHQFPNNVGCGLIERLNVDIPGKTGTMYCAMRMPGEPLMLTGWIDKLFGNLFRQVSVLDMQGILFYWPVNLLGVLALVTYARSDDRRVRNLGLLFIGLTLVHLGTIAISQNQFRYLVILIPVAFILLSIWSSDHFPSRIRRYRPALAAVGLTVCVGLDVLLAGRIRAEATASAREIGLLREFVAVSIPADARVVVESGAVSRSQVIKDALKLGYVLSPRPTLLVPDNRYDDAVYRMLIEKFAPQVLIMLRDEDLQGTLEFAVEAEVKALPGDFGAYSLYRAKLP